jgi:hypothetical protein
MNPFSSWQGILATVGGAVVVLGFFLPWIHSPMGTYSGNDLASLIKQLVGLGHAATFMKERVGGHDNNIIQVRMALDWVSRFSMVLYTLPLAGLLAVGVACTRLRRAKGAILLFLFFLPGLAYLWVVTDIPPALKHELLKASHGASPLTWEETGKLWHELSPFLGIGVWGTAIGYLGLFIAGVAEFVAPSYRHAGMEHIIRNRSIHTERQDTARGCMTCGVELPSDAAFCHKCGSRVAH